MKYKSSSIKSKIHHFFLSYGQFSTLKNGFCSVSFEKINVLDLNLYTSTGQWLSGRLSVRFVMGKLQVRSPAGSYQRL